VKSIIFLIIFTQVSFSLSAEISCPTRILNEVVDGREVEVIELLNVPSTKGTFQKSDAFGSNEDMVIGFDYNSHTYDSVFDARHDGHHLALGRKGKKPKKGTRPTFGKVRTGREKMHHGNFLVFQNVSLETRQKLYDYMKTLKGKELRQTSCIRSTCKLIEKGTGIKVKGRLPWLPSNIFRKIIKDGFVDEFGNSVEYKIYRVEGKTLQQTLNRLEEREAEKLEKVKPYIEKAKKVGLGTIIVVGGAVAGIYLHESDKE
jgi:hypothetical protein